jgi:DNA-binding CsgD family transcriptional regulator
VKQTAVRARIRQLCCLGLPGELLMAALLPALRELVPSDSAGFFWVDARGDMSNLYAERLLPPDVMALYFERYYNGREAAFRKGFLERAQAPDGVVASSADGELRKSEYYNEILRRPRRPPRALRHRARAGRGARPALALPARRRAGLHAARARRPDQRDALRGARRRRGEARPPDADAAFAFEDTDEEAMLVVDRMAVVRHASEKARRLVLLATTSDINPPRWAPRSTTAPRRRCAASARSWRRSRAARTRAAGAGARVEVGALRAARLLAGRRQPVAAGADRRAHPAPGADDPALRARDGAPAALAAAARDRAAARARPSNQEIADNLGVSGNTVAYHIKQLFQKLDVHDRAGAVARIASGHASLRP